MPDLDAVRRVNALGSLLGQPGDPVMCKVLPGISVHWYPTAAPPGTALRSVLGGGWSLYGLGARGVDVPREKAVDQRC
jgi:hypothetical protein